MTHLDPHTEQKLADMSSEEFDLLLARVRPPEEPTDPKARATAALRRFRGLDRTAPATAEQAADAMRRYAAGGGD